MPDDADDPAAARRPVGWTTVFGTMPVRADMVATASASYRAGNRTPALLAWLREIRREGAATTLLDELRAETDTDGDA
jgi:hypothetical protein